MPDEPSTPEICDRPPAAYPEFATSPGIERGLSVMGRLSGDYSDPGKTLIESGCEACQIEGHPFTILPLTGGANLNQYLVVVWVKQLVLRYCNPNDFALVDAQPSQGLPFKGGKRLNNIRPKHG